MFARRRSLLSLRRVRSRNHWFYVNVELKSVIGGKGERSDLSSYTYRTVPKTTTINLKAVHKDVIHKSGLFLKGFT